MVKTKDRVYAAKAKKVVILWDLDNKLPRGPLYEAAQALKSMAKKFGDVIDIAAYSNHHAFIHLPYISVYRRKKKMNRMRSMKGKKRRNFKERFIDGNEKYNEAARHLVTPKVGYGLAQDLRRVGVYVKTD
ncbi:hypothetical protein SASPL_115559 [Salvia splendens]|uniref:Isochorismatase-like domain-containing protein n=1 Tax=Salvia splendens TaxID=180675 RepID=A0A8X8Y5B6_SALSN|nr:hypothetical protein SASPL_115559 [Salvia splendens]